MLMKTAPGTIVWMWGDQAVSAESIGRSIDGCKERNVWYGVDEDNVLFRHDAIVDVRTPLATLPEGIESYDCESDDDEPCTVCGIPSTVARIRELDEAAFEASERLYTAVTRW